ncbi:MAG: DUF2911 domain-containing protein [Flavobacteriales bacterium]
MATVAIGLSAIAQDLPKASPLGEVKQVVGLTNVDVTYSRPSVKGRKIFGELLPFDKLWRLGANANTTISFDSPVLINGEKLDKGTYSMFAIPGKDTWMIIFNKNSKQSGEGDYKKEEDALRVKAAPKTCAFTETLTFDFDSVKDDKANLVIRWENTQVSVEIAANATPQALANIQKAMGEKDVKASTYGNSARFMLDRGMKPAEALKWAETAVKMDPKFYNMYTLSLAFAANDKYKDAVEMAKKSMLSAKEARNDAYVNMNEENIKEWMPKAK